MSDASLYIPPLDIDPAPLAEFPDSLLAKELSDLERVIKANPNRPSERGASGTMNQLPTHAAAQGGVLGGQAIKGALGLPPPNARDHAAYVMEANIAAATLGRPGPVAGPGAVRSFSSGATRSSEAGRYDPEGFMSPIVLERFCEYMNKHRVQPDGSVRDSDNWQKGIPRATYLKGMWRHLLHLWTRVRGYQVQDPMAAVDAEEDLCAILFNAQGLLFELLKNKRRGEEAV